MVTICQKKFHNKKRDFCIIRARDIIMRNNYNDVTKLLNLSFAARFYADFAQLFNLQIKSESRY